MKVIVALDDSPYSKHVLDIMCRRKWPQDTQFKIVSVLEPIDTSEVEAELEFASMLKDVEQRRMKHAEKLCGEARLRLEDHIPSSIVHFEIRKGDAREQIVECAAEWNADRIVIGAKGRDICCHNLLGSVSRSVVRQAQCSVEVVRPHHREESKHPQTKKLTAKKR